MRVSKLAVIAALLLSVFVIGCQKTTVDSNDVKNWQNEGRAEGDKAPDAGEIR